MFEVSDFEHPISLLEVATSIPCAIAQSQLAAGRDSIVDPLMLCTGVEPRHAEKETSIEVDNLLVYPNPSPIGWHVLIPTGTGKLRIIDLQGKVISTVDIPPHTAEWYLAAYESGMFILQSVSHEGGILTSEKIIMQR